MNFFVRIFGNFSEFIRLGMMHRLQRRTYFRLFWFWKILRHPKKLPMSFLLGLFFKFFFRPIKSWDSWPIKELDLKTSLYKMGCCTFCMFRNRQREQHDWHQLDHSYNLQTNKHLLYKIGNLQQPTQIVITSYYSYNHMSRIMRHICYVSDILRNEDCG